MQRVHAVVAEVDAALVALAARLGARPADPRRRFRGDRRPAERRQVLAAERAARRGAGDRLAVRGHDARRDRGALRDRRRPRACPRHRRASSQRRRRRANRDRTRTPRARRRGRRAGRRRRLAPLDGAARAVLDETRDRARVVLFNKSDLGTAGYEARDAGERDALSGSVYRRARPSRRCAAAIADAGWGGEQPDLARPHLASARQADAVARAREALRRRPQRSPPAHRSI